MALTGTFYLLNCIRALTKKYFKGKSMLLESLYIFLIFGLSIFSSWFQNKYTPITIQDELAEADNVTGTMDLIRRHISPAKHGGDLHSQTKATIKVDLEEQEKNQKKQEDEQN